MGSRMALESSSSSMNSLSKLSLSDRQDEMKNIIMDIKREKRLQKEDNLAKNETKKVHHIGTQIEAENDSNSMSTISNGLNCSLSNKQQYGIMDRNNKNKGRKKGKKVGFIKKVKNIRDIQP